jgi:hypothetical protein
MGYIETECIRYKPTNAAEKAMLTSRLAIFTLRFVMLLGLWAPSCLAWAAECSGDFCPPEACAPAFGFIEPDGVLDVADRSFTIRWHDTDPDQNAVISLYYDTDSAGADGQPIAQGLPEDPDGIIGNQFYWDTGGVPEGKYFIYAVIDDGRHPALTVYSPHAVTVHHAVLNPYPIRPEGLDYIRDFGYAVALSGNYAIVGAPGEGNPYAIPGRAFVFTRIGSYWAEQSELTIEELSFDWDKFGFAVDIDGDTAIVGAPNGLITVQSGTAFIFRRQGSRWVKEDQIKPNGLAYSYYTRLGHAVAISGERVAVGAPNYKNSDDNLPQMGTVYIYKREGSEWHQEWQLSASDKAAWDEFGTSVAISASHVIVGAPKNDDHGSDSGSAYVYHREPEGWAEVKLTASDAAAGAGFGTTVAITESWAAVGAVGDDADGTDSGAVYVFEYNGTVWEQTGKISPPAIDIRGFGRRLDLDGDTLIVGALQDPESGAIRDKAFAYRRINSMWVLLNQWTGMGNGVSVDRDYALLSYFRESDKVVNVVTLRPATILAEAASIRLGESTSLMWHADGFESVSIEPGIGNVEPSSRMSISPVRTTSYRITASGTRGTFTHSVTVAVTPQIGISTSSAWLLPAEAATLSWTSEGADQVTIDNGIGAVPPTGSMAVRPGPAETLYRITASGPGGESTAEVLLTVLSPSALNEIKLRAEKPDPVVEAGTAMAVDGDWMAVGVPYDSEGADVSGAVRLFRREGRGWRFVQKLKAANPREYEKLGTSVAIDGAFLAAGGPGIGRGSVIIFRLEGDGWVEQARVASADSFWNLDTSLALTGDLLAVGADQAVYLFQRSCAQWDPVAKLTASDAARGQLFGRAVAADGNTIVVGAPGGDYTEIPGSAYIFGQQGETWVQQARLTASDTAIKDFFGHAVAVSGNSVIVGGYGNRDRGSWTGAAYVFEKSGSGWSQTARLVAGDRAQYDHFGYALAIQGGRAVVGSPGDMQRGYMAGAVHVFTRGASGWKEAAKLTAGDAHDSDNFGLALALDGDLLGVVAEGFFPWGAAYAYSLALLPPEVELRAEPASIAQGGSSLLSWNAQQAETCAIEPGIGAVAASGSLAVSPNATTTYRITAKGPGGAASAQITVTVQTRPPVAGLSADPQIIYFGESAKLTWTASHADSRLLEPDVGPVSEAGSILVSPSETTSYKLTVTGTGGSAEALAVVTVIKTTGVVSGTIIDSDTGQPLQGVAITITQGSQTRTVYTDADGRFWVTRIGAGEITLTFSIEGYPPLTLNQSIDAGQVLPFVLKLKKVLLQTDTRLTGRITDAASGAAIPGAKITIADSNKTQAVTADAGGAYRVVEIASGKVQLGVSHPDYFPQTWIYQLPGKVTYTVNFALSPKSGRATIEGVVINAKTVQPEAGVELSIEGTLLSAVSDEDGAFTLEDVPMGEQALKVYKKGFVNLVQPITVDSDPFPLELVYPLVFAKARPEQVGKNVTGLVADAVSGRPLPGAILKIRALGLAVAADADGLYSLSGLPPGLITIIAMAPDHEALMLTPVVAEGAAETLDFRLPPTTRGRITGRVFDAATGEAIRFAQVRIGEGSQVAASSEASGTYALLGAPTGGYRLLVFHPEYGEQESQPFTVRDTETTAGVDVALNRRPVTGDLEGVLTDAQTLGAVGGAKLTIQGAAASALADESGRYELRDAPAGLVTIVIEATGYPTAARTAAVNAHEGSATRTVSRADFRIDAHDPVLPWEVSILIEASAGGFIETPDKRFVVGFPPGALSADAWVTLRPPADGPLVGPGDELEVDPALWLPQEFAAAAPVEIVIEPAAGGAPQPEIAGPVLVSGRYAQADADAFELSEASIFPFYWDGVRWTLLQFSPFETAVDLINNEPVAVLDFSAAISGGALSPDARALESSSGLLRRCMMVFAAIKKRLGPPTPNVNVVDSPELLATKRGLEPRKKPNPNALPLVYIHGWNWNTILVNDELVDPDIGFNELGELIEAEAPMLAFMLNDIVEATNGVYRLMFATHNSRVDILSNGNTLAGILDPQKIYGLPSENNPEPPAFPYLDTVAFSLGGLISRSYQANTGHVHNMVLIGTPNHGTFGVLKLLELHPMYGLYKKIIERWSPGTKDLLHYDDRDNPEKSANPRLAHLNLNPKAAPQSDLTLIAGTDNSKLSGLILPKPNDSVVPVDSVFCRTTDSKDDPKASLLSVCPEAHGRPNLKYEHTAPFNHYTFGAAEFRVRDNEDVRDAILHGLTDWVVSKLLDSKIMTFTDTYYIKSADFTVEVEYNTFKPNEQDLEAGRTGRDIDRVALVIYGQDESGRWHVRGDYAGGDGKLLRSESVVGNSINDDPPITLSTSALFTESEKIVRVAFVVARLRPGRTEVPLDPSGGFGLPNK